ncbi:MAG TPA: hypothetical protein VFF86_01335 [Candidatus Methylomirabilis sp.]|nr:hypothetical protein [Candidatus Methylomirabilis sp.]
MRLKAAVIVMSMLSAACVSAQGASPDSAFAEAKHDYNVALGSELVDPQYEVGDLVVYTSSGELGVISSAGDSRGKGQMLILRRRSLVGMAVDWHDIRLATDADTGAAQLAHELIRLGSHIIEKRLIV